MTGPVCGCLLDALARQAPDRGTEPGCSFHCADHDQMMVWTGVSWLWSNQPEDLEQLPRMADCATAGTLPD